MRMAARSVKPRLVISQTANKWNIRSESTFKTVAYDFVPDIGFDETTPDGREVNVGDECCHGQRSCRSVVSDENHIRRQPVGEHVHRQERQTVCSHSICQREWSTDDREFHARASCHSRSTEMRTISSRKWNAARSRLVVGSNASNKRQSNDEHWFVNVHDTFLSHQFKFLHLSTRIFVVKRHKSLICSVTITRSVDFTGHVIGFRVSPYRSDSARLPLDAKTTNRLSKVKVTSRYR
jgi:hypothetical protein